MFHEGGAWLRSLDTRERVQDFGRVGGGADERVADGLIIAAVRAFLPDDAVHLRAVDCVRALDGADGKRMCVSTGGGVRERCTGSGQSEGVVGIQRPADLDR